MNPRYNLLGELDFWFVLPSRSLRALLIRKLRQQYPELNYQVDWKDTHGWGLHLTVASWVQPGGFYVCPD